MEKLIELLNKAQNSGVGLFGHWIGNFERKYYAKNHWRLIIETLGYTDEDYEIYDYTDRDICGKDGGFIKWLVENEKIDFDNRDLKDKYMEYFERYPYYPYTDFSLTGLIMLLSIQDEPIEFLVSILK